MTTFAKVENGVVVDVIAAEQDFIDAGYAGDPSQWIQTSYNTRQGVHYGPDGQPDGGVAFRKNYAVIGGTYDAVRDAFIPPKPFDSWALNEDTCDWVPPVPFPADIETVRYLWDEENLQWVPISETNP